MSYDTVAFGSAWKGTRPEPPCPCRCGTAGFCDDHRATLARIREELNQSNRKRGRKMTIPGTRGIAHELEDDE